MIKRLNLCFHYYSIYEHSLHHFCALWQFELQFLCETYFLCSLYVSALFANVGVRDEQQPTCQNRKFSRKHREEINCLQGGGGYEISLFNDT